MKRSVFTSEKSDKLEFREEAGGIGYNRSHLLFHSQAYIEHLMCVTCSPRCWELQV